MRILKDSADCSRELFAALPAFQDNAIHVLDVKLVYILASTMDTLGAIRPPKFGQVFVGLFFIIQMRTSKDVLSHFPPLVCSGEGLAFSWWVCKVSNHP